MTAFAWEKPVATGSIRNRPEDFRVIENLGYVPSGEGEHLWLRVEKRAANTLDVARDLARFAGVHPRQVGFAGLKDRNAVTRQSFSIHMPGRCDPDWSSWPTDPFRVLSVSRHVRKIRRGRLSGNRFELIVRDLKSGLSHSDLREKLESRLKTIATHGVPNGFGEQRFGGNNIARALALFQGELRRKPSKSKRGFYLSAARSLIFNQVLAGRIQAGSWNRLIEGDVVMLDGSRSIFVADPADLDQQYRCERMDLHPTGPMVGHGTDPSDSEAGCIEQAVIERNQELFEGLKTFGLKAERRSLRMKVSDLNWTFEDEQTLRLGFSLQRGGYATSLLREIIDYTDVGTFTVTD